jgi:solute carrier family 44 protein 1 (choline transporter-like protein)/choline transporter-like protein 2/4/5
VLYYIDPFAVTSPNATFVCLAACPTNTTFSTPETAICEYGFRPKNMVDLVDSVKNETCSPYTYQSESVLGRCVPTQPIPSELLAQTVSFGNYTVSLQSLLDRGRDGYIKIVADLSFTWPMLAAAAGTGIIISFIWLFMAQYIVGPFVWLSVFVMNVVLAGLAALSYFYWNSRKVAFDTNTLPSGIVSVGTNMLPGSATNAIGNYTISKEIPFLSSQTAATANEVQTAFIVFVTLVTLFGIFLLITIAMIKRIKLAIEIINEASQAFLKMPGISKTQLI